MMLLESVGVQCDMCRFRNDDTKLSAKPKRALSAYNIFFRDQRERILSASPRKSVGGFGPLARNVASKWKQLSADERKYFEDLAKEEKERYKREMEQWKKDYRTLEACHAGICTCSNPPMSSNVAIEAHNSNENQNYQSMAFCAATNPGALHANISNESSTIIPSFVQSTGLDIKRPEVTHSSHRETIPSAQELGLSSNLSVLFSKLDDDCLDILSCFT